MISPEALAKLEETILGAAAHLDRQQVSQLSGVSVEEASKLWRALGFPDAVDGEIGFTELDVEALTSTTILRSNELLSEASSIQVTRAMGQAMSHLAEAQMDIAVERLSQIPGVQEIARDTPDQLVDLAIMSSAILREPLETLVLYVYRRHLLAAAQRYLSAATANPEEGVVTQLAVGFCDISGFTSFTRELEGDELAALINTFESTAFDIVVQAGARVVKTLGDSVMFVTDNPGTSVAIALELTEAFADGSLGVPAVHIGVAYGSATTRAGDVFGSAVNIASRCTSIARPSTVVVDRGILAALEDDERFQLRKLRPHKVRGYDNLQVGVARWALEEGELDDARRERLERHLERVRHRAELVAGVVNAIPALLHPEPED